MVLCAALYGCTSSVQQSGGISGAATTGASGRPAAAPSVSLAPVAGYSPSFRIPADLNLEFQTSDQGSSTANQVETVLVDQYEGFIEAISTGQATETTYRYLTAGDALTVENTELTWWKKQGERLTGTDRLYAFSVRLSGTDQAVYSFCEDSTKLEYRKLSGGKTVPNTAGVDGNYTLRQGTLVKGKGELWQVRSIMTQDGAASCIGK